MTDKNRDLFRDAFRYFDKYESLPMEPDDFVSAAHDMDDYVKRHDSTLLAKDLFGAIYTHLGNRWREDQRRAEEHAEQVGFQMVSEAENETASVTD